MAHHTAASQTDASGSAQGPNPRRLPLAGAVNFRDLGGYITDDGRRVRWGKLFRSDVLADLTDADVEILARTGLRTICDLRGESERAQKPNRLLQGAPVEHPIGFMPHRGEELLTATRAGTIPVAEIETRVREIYRRFVTDQTGTYSRLLELIRADTLPLLFHCTSGRDRSGFAAAVVLLVLGVPRRTIAEDYGLSNQYRRDLTFQIGGAVEAAVMAALTRAHPDYLAEAFAAIDTGWGSDAQYLQRGLGLTPKRRSELRELLLESSKEKS
jgi:protein-tyrosine phosphatase